MTQGKGHLELPGLEKEALVYFSHLRSSPTILFRPYSVAQTVTARTNTGATCSECCSICVIFRVAPLGRKEGERGQGKYLGTASRRRQKKQELTEQVIVVSQSCGKQMCHCIPRGPILLVTDSWILQDAVADSCH